MNKPTNPPGMAPGTPPILQLRGIAKLFPGVVANKDVDLDVWPGEIHALLGENGAGKSTLMNVVTGIYQPEEGEIILDGYGQTFSSPQDAIRAGIGMVHQHFKLVEAFSVAENIHLAGTKRPASRHPPSWKPARARFRNASAFPSGPMRVYATCRRASSSVSRSCACWRARPAC